MASSTEYYIRDSTTDLYMDEHGNILKKGDIIVCRKHTIIVTEDGYIDHYTSGAMDNNFQAPDLEFKVLQEKVKNQNSREQSRHFIGRMLLTITGNNKTSKKQVAPQRLLNESSEARALCSANSLDGSYIDRNIVNKVNGTATVAENEMQNVKQLIIRDFNEKCDEYFRVLFQNVDIDNQEIIIPLVAEYNLRVRNLLVEI